MIDPILQTEGKRPKHVIQMGQNWITIDPDQDFSQSISTGAG
jgi:hypothetical protein